MSDGLTIHEYSDDLAIHFRDINAEWITAMFRLEDTDREVLGEYRGQSAFFVAAPNLHPSPDHRPTCRVSAASITSALPATCSSRG